jgi:hypothetical protein
MAWFFGVYGGLWPRRHGADTAGLGSIRLGLGSGIGLLPKRSRLARDRMAMAVCRASGFDCALEPRYCCYLVVLGSVLASRKRGARVLANQVGGRARGRPTALRPRAAARR